MGKFLITEEEKSKILGMYYKNTGKTLVKEDTTIPDNMWKSYIDAVNKAKSDAMTISSPPNMLSPEYIKDKNYSVAFATRINGVQKSLWYQCIDDEPRTKKDDTFFKAGQIYNDSFKLSDAATELNAGGTPWKEMFSWACKPAMAVLAARQAKAQPQAQVAAATTVATPTAAPVIQKTDAEKSIEQRKIKSDEANAKIKTLMSAEDFLNYNKDKATLDNEVNQLNTLLNLSQLSSEDKMALRNKVRVLIKYKPEYGQAPYYLMSSLQ